MDSLMGELQNLREHVKECKTALKKAEDAVIRHHYAIHEYISGKHPTVWICYARDENGARTRLAGVFLTREEVVAEYEAKKQWAVWTVMTDPDFVEILTSSVELEELLRHLKITT
jgi:hypothetical protein